MLLDFLFEACGPSPRREVSHAGLRGDGETRGHAKAHVGHLRKIGAFAAQQLPHVGIALSEAVDVLRAGLRVNSYHALSPSRVAQQRRVAGRMALYIVARRIGNGWTKAPLELKGRRSSSTNEKNAIRATVR